MCCCKTANVNGTPGYSWDGKTFSTRPVDPPDPNGANILFDEPGRCGGQDSHSYHYRIVGAASGACFPTLLVKHGGGEETIRLSNGKQVFRALEMLDSNGRYWLLNALYHAQSDARQAGREAIDSLWRRAAAEKRIKVRKVRGQDVVRVEIAHV